jgi:hypothetical protein
MITDKQKEILLLMNNGWELGYYTGTRSSSGGYTLQKGGLGHGGECRHHIRSTSIDALEKAGYIKVIKMGFPIIRTYGITENGKKFLYGGD